MIVHNRTLFSLLALALFFTATGAAQEQKHPRVDLVRALDTDQYLASRFRGTDVLDADDQKIGNVSDMLFAKSGRVDAYIVSVGGFLGLGAKEIAFAPSSFEIIPGQNGSFDKLKIYRTKDDFIRMPSFTRDAPQPQKPE